MKIALMGDIHANLPALTAVLAHAELNGAEEFWNIGDFIGYGPFPNEVIDQVRKIRSLSVIGNYDRKVLRFSEKATNWRKNKLPDKFIAFKWAFEQLTPENRIYLSNLPETLQFTRGKWEILITHASPDDPKEHLYPNTPNARLRELAQNHPVDIIVCGHSHQPFARLVDHTLFINTGSVGRPDDGDPRACYALLNLESNTYDVHHYRVEYPVAQIVDAIKALLLPEHFARMFIQGRNLEAILKESG